ncbi:MAG: rod shape-determining protein MreD [Candidatus Cloacimonadales bacterium]|nr:rod shape-determining protein MreD [Candidatus Cloacimonadales bacterium]
MKTIKLIFWGILLLYAQILLAEKFSLLGIIPNFLIAYIIYVNIKTGLITSLSISFFLGLLFDLVQPNLLGLHSLSFITISLLIQNFHPSINKKRFIVVLFSILFVNFIYYLLFVLYHFISLQKLPGFFLLFLFAVAYNTFISIISIYFFTIMSKLKLTIDV